MENSYLYTVLALASVAFASFVIYDAQRLREARFTLGIILLASLILPISSAVKGFSELDFDTGGDYATSSLANETVEEAFCRGIAEAVCGEFSFKTSDVSVKAVGFDAEGMRAEKIILTLSGKAALGDIGAAEDFVSELGFGKCTAEVYFG